MSCPFDKTEHPPEHFLKIYRLHPDGIKIEKANNKLSGSANAGAVKYCGPYIHANQSGWWIYPPFDVDLTYLGEGKWEETILSDYEPTHQIVIDSNVKPNDKFKDNRRMLVGKGLAAPEIYQIWTGCTFKTPPGWGLHMRTPVNFTEAFKRPFWIQEGILETDWLQYDIWINLEFHTVNQKACLRRNMWPPLAQILPVRRDSYQSNWSTSDEIIDSSNPDHEEVWTFWQDYNYAKWLSSGEKDPLTYHKMRKEKARQCPYSSHDEPKS
jgi:hypothetical protein